MFFKIPSTMMEKTYLSPSCPLESKTYPFKSCTRLLAVLAATLLLAVSGHSATMLYQDDFNFTGELDGRTPPVTTDGNSWTAAESFEADGESVSPLGGSISAYLPFTPETGYIYELTASMANASGNVGWISLGFSEFGNVDNHFATMSVNGYGTMILRGNENIAWFSGPRNSGDLTGDVGITTPPSGFNDVELVLNTEQPSWTMDLFVNGIQIDLNAGNPDSMTYVWASNPDIHFVTLSSSTNNSTARYGDFSLLQIPEPTSIGMLLGGLALLLVLRRRRRASALH